ncbi:hypothetical protein C8R46DRAFT_1211478 [Mycena filopes]|nr:hypothetical protein C8R46DRAFT_1211478 [Mycena filopes]
MPWLPQEQGTFLVDSFPFLKYVPAFMPGAGFKTKARAWRKVVSSMPDVPYNFVKESLEGRKDSEVLDSWRSSMNIQAQLLRCRSRHCAQGKDLTEWSMWITITSILAAFNMTKSLDAKHYPIEPSEKYTSGLLIYPMAHDCGILPKSEEARALIKPTL